MRGVAGELLDEMARIPFAAYGYVFQKTLLLLCPVLGAGSAGAFGGELSFAVYAAIAFCLAALVWRADSPKLRRVLFLLGVGSQVVSALLLFASTLSGAQPALLVSLQFAAHSFGVVLVSALWIDLYAALNPVRALFAAAVVVVLSRFAHFALADASALRLDAVCLVLPLASACSLIVARKRIVGDAGKGRAAFGKRVVPKRAVFLIALYAFSYGAISSLVGAGRQWGVDVIPAIVIIVLVLALRERFDASALYRLMFSLMIAGFLLAAFAGGELLAVSSLSMDAAYATLNLLVVFVVAVISYNAAVSGLFLFCVLMGVQMLFHALGALSGSLLVGSGLIDYSLSILVSILLVAVLVPLSISKNGVSSLFDGLPVDPAALEGASVTPERALQAKARGLAQACGLTERETEILQLIVKRQSNAEIARTLVISEGTVKTHTHRIYQKVGVRSRAELLATVEGAGADYRSAQ